MKISIRKVSKLEVQGEMPKDTNAEIEVTLRCWIKEVIQPVKHNEDDDVSPIFKVEVMDGKGEVTLILPSALGIGKGEWGKRQTKGKFLTYLRFFPMKYHPMLGAEGGIVINFFARKMKIWLRQ